MDRELASLTNPSAPRARGDARRAAPRHAEPVSHAAAGPAAVRRRARGVSAELIQAGLFVGMVLTLAVLAALRAAPFDRPADAGVVNGQLAHAFEAHYDKQFPAKTLGTNLWAALDYVVFREGRPGVAIGARGWLFSDEELKAHGDGEAQVKLHLKMIGLVRDELRRRGVALLVAPLPAKARIYPENLGDQRVSPQQAALYPRLQAALRESGVLAPDLAAALLRCKQDAPTFLRTDTHWTEEGARCAAQDIGRALRAAGMQSASPRRYRTEHEAPQAHHGDLLRFLPLDPYFARLLPAPDRIAVARTTPAEDDAGSDLFADAPAPQVALIGTSYSADSRWNFVGALQEALGEDVVNYAVEAKGPFLPMLDYLQGSDLSRSPPRLVIWEIPERYLPIAEDLRAYRLPQLQSTSIHPGAARHRRVQYRHA